MDRAALAARWAGAGGGSGQLLSAIPVMPQTCGVFPVYRQSMPQLADWGKMAGRDD